MKLRTKIVLTEGERLFAARLQSGMSQKAVSQKSGFHQTAVSKMESGAIPINPRLLSLLTLQAKRDVPDWAFLRIVRKRLGLEQKFVSSQTGLATHVIGEMETGKRPVDPAYESFLAGKL